MDKCGMNGSTVEVWECISNAVIKAKQCYQKGHKSLLYLSGVPDYFGRNKISSGGDLSHYSSASLY